MKHTRQRTILWVLLLGALCLQTAAKYEDQFGKVWDWKKEGLSKPVGALATATGTFLVQDQSFSVIDPLGRIKTTVDLDFSSYAIDGANNRAYFLESTRNAVQKFNILSGEFVETLSYNQGEILSLRIVDSKLHLTFKNSVFAGALEQPLSQIGRKFGEKVVLVDSTSKYVLHQKATSFCVQSLSKPKDKELDKEQCIKKERLTYLHPSTSGFWFYNESDQSLVHLTSSQQQTIKIAVSADAVLRANIIADFVLIQDNKHATAYTIDEAASTLNAVSLGEYHACNYSPIPSFSTSSAACVSNSKDGQRTLIKAVSFKNTYAKATVLGSAALQDRHIDSFWLSSAQGDSNWLTVLTSDGQVSALNERGNSVWSKSTDFGQISSVLVAEFHSTAESNDIAQYESFGANFVGAFLFRVFTDIQDLKNLALNAFPKLVEGLNMNALIEKIKGNSATVLEDISYYNKYGLRKNLIFITSTNKLFSIDSLSGKELWQQSLKPGQKIIKSFINDQNNINLIFSENGKKFVTEISSSDGTFTTGSKPLDSSSSVYFVNENANGIAQISFKDNVVANLNQEYAYYRVDHKKGVSGYIRTSDGKFEEIWNYLLEPGQQIIGYSYHLKGDSSYLHKLKQGSLVTLPEEEALYYKVVDSGNLGLVIRHTVNSVDSVVVTLLNTVKGKVLATYQHSDIDFNQPVVYLYDDNGFFLSYFNPKMLNFELWSIEVYRRKVETAFMDMLQTYVLRTKKPEELDYSREPHQYIILDRKYGLNVGLKSLTAVTTPSSLTKRNLIGVTLSNDIVSFDRILVSARRNDEAALKKEKGKGKLSYHSMVYPPYAYSLPVSYTSILNANWKLSGIQRVLVVPTKFESTSLIVALGKDLFVTKVQPDNTFDMLNDDFNYILLGLVSVVITVLVVVLRRLAKNAETKKRFFSS